MQDITSERFKELICKKIRLETQIAEYEDVSHYHDRMKRKFDRKSAEAKALLHSVCIELHDYEKQRGICMTQIPIISHFKKEFHHLFYEMIREINSLLEEPFSEEEGIFEQQVNECIHLSFKKDIKKGHVHIAISKMFLRAGDEGRSMFIDKFGKEKFFALLADPSYCTGLGTQAAIKQGVNTMIKIERGKKT